MATSRKELLLNEKVVEQKPHAEMEHAALEEGTAFSQMRNTYGWKLLMDRYIGPKIEKNRFFMAKNEELLDVRASMKALQDLVDYIDRRVNEAIKITERSKS